MTYTDYEIASIYLDPNSLEDFGIEISDTLGQKYKGIRVEDEWDLGLINLTEL